MIVCSYDRLKIVAYTKGAHLFKQTVLLGSRDHVLPDARTFQLLQHLDGAVKKSGLFVFDGVICNIHSGQTLKRVIFQVEPQTLIILYHGKTKLASVFIDTGNPRQISLLQKPVHCLDTGVHILKERPVPVPYNIPVFHYHTVRNRALPARIFASRMKHIITYRQNFYVLPILKDTGIKHETSNVNKP